MGVRDAFIRLPWPARQAAVFAQSGVNRAIRFGRGYRRNLSLFEQTPHWSATMLRDYQSAQLCKLLLEARDNTDYYADALGSLSVAAIRELSSDLDLNALPLLAKATLKRETSRFENKRRRAVVETSTSGSTGSPLKVRYDRASVQERFALLHRFRRWGGVEPFDRQARFSGRLLGRREDPAAAWLWSPFDSTLLVSTYHLTDEHLGRIVQRLQRFRPALLEGYPTAISQLASYASSHGVKVDSLRMVVTTAETLSPDMRDAIRTGLQAPVYDYYAASEGVPFICQCEAGKYHVCLDSGVFEFLRSDGTPARAGEVAQIVVTSFCQWMTPLVRYQTGDLAELPATLDPCPCGRNFPVVAAVLGRLEDLVITRDRRRIGMFAYRTLKYVSGLKEAQIVQTGYDAFVLKAVPEGSRAVEDIQRQAEHIFRLTLEDSVNVTIEVVPSIPRGPNGKFRSVVRTFEAD